jgi:hypothetical protein
MPKLHAEMEMEKVVARKVQVEVEHIEQIRKEEQEQEQGTLTERQNLTREQRKSGKHSRVRKSMASNFVRQQRHLS